MPAFSGIKTTLKSFREEIRSSSETAFFVLLILHLCAFLIGKIRWAANENVMVYFKWILQLATMLGAAAFLIYVIIRWKYAWKDKIFFLIPAVALFPLPLIFNFHGDSTWYFALMDLFLCLIAYEKDYKKILRCYLWIYVGCLLFALIGLPLGITKETAKSDSAFNFSFGIYYPNTWGQFAFLIMVAFWYFYLQKRKWITFLVFWFMGIFMYIVPECKTITLFCIAFPFFMLFVKNDHAKENKPLRIMMAAFPFICFAVTMILCWQMDIVKKYTYGNALVTLGLRFVQGGIAFQHYGFPLIGHSLTSNPNIISVVNGEAEVLYVLDNAYITFSLFRGAIWMLWALCWLGYANWRGMKNKDGALVLISSFFLVLALIERPGLEAAYNFIFLYPLANVASLKESEEKLSLRSLFSFSLKESKNEKPKTAAPKKTQSKKKKK